MNINWKLSHNKYGQSAKIMLIWFFFFRSHLEMIRGYYWPSTLCFLWTVLRGSVINSINILRTIGYSQDQTWVSHMWGRQISPPVLLSLQFSDWFLFLSFYFWVILSFTLNLLMTLAQDHLRIVFESTSRKSWNLLTVLYIHLHFWFIKLLQYLVNRILKYIIFHHYKHLKFNFIV